MRQGSGRQSHAHRFAFLILEHQRCAKCDVADAAMPSADAELAHAGHVRHFRRSRVRCAHRHHHVIAISPRHWQERHRFAAWRCHRHELSSANKNSRIGKPRRALIPTVALAGAFSVISNVILLVNHWLCIARFGAPNTVSALGVRDLHASRKILAPLIVARQQEHRMVRVIALNRRRERRGGRAQCGARAGLAQYGEYAGRGHGGCSRCSRCSRRSRCFAHYDAAIRRRSRSGTRRRCGRCCRGGRRRGRSSSCRRGPRRRLRASAAGKANHQRQHAVVGPPDPPMMHAHSIRAETVRPSVAARPLVSMREQARPLPGFNGAENRL